MPNQMDSLVYSGPKENKTAQTQHVVSGTQERVKMASEKSPILDIAKKWCRILAQKTKRWVSCK